MGRRRLSGLGLLVSVALVAAACGRSVPDGSAPPVTLVPVKGGEITVGINAAPTNCSPNTIAGDTWADRLVLEPVLPSTFFVSPGGTPAPNQALVEQAELTSTNPQTVVYTLNPKAVWSDGVPIGVADFVYAWQQQRHLSIVPGDTGNEPTTTMGYRDIASVTGSNSSHTVTVIFKKPFSDWQMLFNYMMPAHVMTAGGAIAHCNGINPAVDLSGGPFVIRSISRSGTIMMVKNPRWWGIAPSISVLRIKVARSSAQLAAWVKDGVVQVAQPDSFNPGFLQAISEDPYVMSESGISARFLQVVFAMTSPACQPLAMREAIAYSLNRQAILNSVLGWANAGIAVSTSHLYSESQGAYPSLSATPSALVAGNEPSSTTTTLPPASSGSPYPATAVPSVTRSLLQAQGFTRSRGGLWHNVAGKPLSLRLAVDEADTWASETGRLVANQLRAAGFSVTVLPASSSSAAGIALASGNADIGVIPYDSTPYPSQAIAWYTPLLGQPGQAGSKDWGNLDNATLNQLLSNASAELNPVTATPLYNEADKLLWQQMATLPLFSEPTVLAWSDYVYGVGPNSQGPSLLWFPQTWQTRAVQPLQRRGPPPAKSS